MDEQPISRVIDPALIPSPPGGDDEVPRAWLLEHLRRDPRTVAMVKRRVLRALEEADRG